MLKHGLSDIARICYNSGIKLAQEQGDRINLQEIAEKLLQRSTAVRAALNLARRLEELSLLEKVDERRSQEYVLTDLGKRSLKEKGVYIPERETYEVLLAQDPLIPEKILYIPKRIVYWEDRRQIHHIQDNQTCISSEPNLIPQFSLDRST